MLDGIGYHPSCFVCVACGELNNPVMFCDNFDCGLPAGRSLRGKRICKAKNQLYCEEDYLVRLVQWSKCCYPFCDIVVPRFSIGTEKL